MFVVPDLAYVRLTEGGVAQLHAGDAVPDGADTDHVAQLTEQGVLSKTKPKAKPTGSDSGSVADQS